MHSPLDLMSVFDLFPHPSTGADLLGLCLALQCFDGCRICLLVEIQKTGQMKHMATVEANQCLLFCEQSSVTGYPRKVVCLK